MRLLRGRLLLLLAAIFTTRGQSVHSAFLPSEDTDADRQKILHSLLGSDADEQASRYGGGFFPVNRINTDLAHGDNDEDAEDAVLPSLLDQYLLPSVHSKWHKRRRRQDESSDTASSSELLKGHPCHNTWPPCTSDSDEYANSSLTSSDDNPDDNESESEMKPVIRPSQLKKHKYGRRRNENDDRTTVSHHSKSREHGIRNKRDTSETKTSEPEVVLQKKDPAFSSWGGKRTTAFGAWGGKRDFSFSRVGAIRRRAFTSVGSKRSPALNSWGGKKSHSFSILSKRHPLLSSWGGNSNPSFNILSSMEDEPAFTILSGKRRPSFNSWGGKRDTSSSSFLSSSDEPAFSVLGSGNEPAFSILGGKRTSGFNSWGGKRDPAFKILGNHDYPSFSILGSYYEPAFSILSKKRDPAFSSWGGKRDAAFSSWDGKRDAAFSSWGGKRDAAFSSWGGKRDSGFSSWGGKRDQSTAFSSWGGKRDEENSIWENSSELTKTATPFAILNEGGIEQDKRGFSSWGGKRDSSESTSTDDEMNKRSFSSWGGKRNTVVEESEDAKRSFSSWGGKRASTETEEQEEKHKNKTVTFKDWENRNHSDPDKDEDDSKEEVRKSISTQTSLLSEAYHQLVEDFDNKMQLENEGNHVETESAIPENEVNESIENSRSTQTDNHIFDEENSHDAEREISQFTQTDPEFKISQKEQTSINLEHAPADGKDTSEKTDFSVSKRTSNNARSRIGKAPFSSWGGKRGFMSLRYTPSLLSILGTMHGSGHGRSNSLMPDLLYKRGSSRQNSLGTKKWGSSKVGAVFSSWGGKRSDKNHLRKPPPQSIGRQYRRGTDFYSWGGKR